MESLWTLLHAYQLIALIPLMTINFPSNTLLFFRVCAFANGDIFILQYVFDNILGSLF